LAANYFMIEKNYLLYDSGEYYGPLSPKEIYLMKEAGNLTKDAQVIFEGQEWSSATKISDAKILGSKIRRYEEIHSFSIQEYQTLLLEELRALRTHAVMIQWALGGLGILMLLLLYKGYRIEFKP